MGGTDDPSNLIKVNTKMHAFLHWQLYKEHGLKEDFLACAGLLGLIGKDAILKEVCSLKGKKNPMYGKYGKDHPKYGKKHSKEVREKQSKALSGRVFSDEHLEKIAKTKKGAAFKEKICKKVIVNEVLYPSIKDAAKSLEVSTSWIHRRLKNNPEVARYAD